MPSALCPVLAALLAGSMAFGSLPVLAADSVYRWVDDAGIVHYGDKPPETGAIPVPIEPPPAVQADPQRDRDQELQRRLLREYDREHERERAQQQAARAEQDKRDRKCQAARHDLEAMKNASYLFTRTGDPDNPRILSETERAAQIRDGTAEVHRWCSADAASTQPAPRTGH